MKKVKKRIRDEDVGRGKQFGREEVRRSKELKR
jgi:hypothetical protein